jgi:hypothetical protein
MIYPAIPILFQTLPTEAFLHVSHKQKPRGGVFTRKRGHAAFPTVLIPSLLFLCLAGLLGGAELGLQVKEHAPPKELDPRISAKLQPKSVQLLEGGQPVFEFWFVAELPLTTKPASIARSLDAIQQSMLIGAVRVGKDRRDYRDDAIIPGVYTMRLAIQPNDGNHLGTSEFSWFAALISAPNDPKPDAITDYKSLVKASSKGTTTDHPVILSLRPASSAEEKLPRLGEPAPEHKSIGVRIPAKAGNEATSVVFELVYEGKGHK